MKIQNASRCYDVEVSDPTMLRLGVLVTFYDVKYSKSSDVTKFQIPSCRSSKSHDAEATGYDIKASCNVKTQSSSNLEVTDCIIRCYEVLEFNVEISRLYK